MEHARGVVSNVGIEAFPVPHVSDAVMALERTHAKGDEVRGIEF